MSYPDFMIDKRIIERHISRGLVDKDVFNKTVEALPDMEHNAEACLADPVPKAAEVEEAEVEATGAESVEAESVEAGSVEAESVEAESVEAEDARAEDAQAERTSDAAETAVGGLAAPVEPATMAGQEPTEG